MNTTIAEVLGTLLADQFRRELVRTIGVEACREVDVENHRRNDGDLTCASHDHCDANMVMDAASTSLGITLWSDNELDESPMDDNALALWNRAWSIAKRRGFACG